MLRERSSLIVRLHLAVDILLTILAFVSAYFVKRELLPLSVRGLSTDPDYYLVLFLVVIIWYLCFLYFRLYESYRKQSLPQILLQMTKSVTTGMVFIFLSLYLLKIFDVSRILLTIFFIFNLVFLAISKTVVYYILRRYRRRGLNFRNLLIVGSKEKARNVISEIHSQKESGYRVVGCVELSASDVGKEVFQSVKVIGTLDNLRELILNNVIDGIVFAIPFKELGDPRPYLIAVEEIGIDVAIIPDLNPSDWTYRPIKGRVQLQRFFGHFAITLSSIAPKTDTRAIKNILDYTAAVIGLFLLAPLFAFFAFAIKISSQGPVFYRQERSGLNGRTFMLYKFRTMVADADQKRKELEALNESDGPVFKISKDPRIIPHLGHFLRKTSLDELPQLINVARGEMSLVGPRPPIPAEVRKYEPWQRRRLSMKPGLTCIWQTSPRRNDISFNDWMKLDLEYIDNWSLQLDLKLLIKTLKVVLLGQGR